MTKRNNKHTTSNHTLPLRNSPAVERWIRQHRQHTNHLIARLEAYFRHVG